MESNDKKISFKRKSSNNREPDFRKREEMDLGLSLNTRHDPISSSSSSSSPSPSPPPSSSPQLLPSHQESELLQIETPPETLFPNPSLLPISPATTTPHAPSLPASPAGPPRPPPLRPPRARRNPTQAPRDGKSEHVPQPFPWATNRRATVHSLNTLLSNNIETITGTVQCKRCEKQYEMEFNLQEQFRIVGKYIAENKHSMHDRAPARWMNPKLPKCEYCEQDNCVKPVISDKKKSINWLFLLLGEMLGCCTLDQLKYFCKHTKNHRTGAKDRVLYLTYLELCKQLHPDGPFDL
ncbi:uncharacterized protein LOC110605759 [Manihot esculenta]|uniref:Uncharacterized protein n=3 Tax=Manihot esculenta TaxID=3983 RepID=A0ACB7FYU5_MANES|nr:uncharacterized protein LOC110605759 [Manihot esculenta]KAG8633162.1 hypothetical protein MANES_18G081000v8 [Manihot esculenta]KAG8633163.1 hypothetical protein MANES_18G081000v8 [Manihot esculenta]OAY23462.1 hypothetical protein MANES_18G081000v8 [Manihot esculenta]